MPTDSSARASPFKSTSGIVRILRAATYSWSGLRAAWTHEAAFRQEVALGLLLIVAALVLGRNRFEIAVLIAPVLLVWIVELLNSAIEAVADAVSLEQHPLIAQAKDMGSAAVFMSLRGVVGVWAVVWWP